MITQVALLFLFGTTTASNIFMEKLKSAPYHISIVPSSQYSGCPSGAELAPLICKFMQANIDLYYKPNLIAPSTYIPPLVVEKCDTPELTMDMELPGSVVEKKPVVIPQPPELPPLMIPKFPVPVIVEEQPATVSEPCEISDIPEMLLANIPAAPQLPALEMPIIPEIVEQPEPYFFKEAIPEIDYNIIDEKPMEIPVAPKLPEFTMPEFPFYSQIPSGPVLSAMDIPKIVENPTEEHSLNEVVAAPEIDYDLFKYQPMSIPQPPELPALIMPELSVIAPYFDDKPIAQTPTHAHFAPLASIPAAPELPPAVLPEFPINVEIPSGPVLPPMDFSPPLTKEQPIEEPCLTEVVPEVDYNLVNYQRLTIPQAPKLPAFVMPELATVSFEQEVPTEAYFESLAPIPAAPELTAAVLPEFPVYIEVPSAPAFTAMDSPSPPMIFEEPAEEPYHSKIAAPKIDYSLMKSAPMSMPPPPELPAFVMPELPVRVVEELPMAAAAPELPSAPKLTEYVKPELPSAALPTFVGKPCESSGTLEVEFATMPNPFERFFNDKATESHNIIIPAQSFYPSPCVYNLVMQHVVPNIASDHFRSLEKMKVLPPSFLPCS